MQGKDILSFEQFFQLNQYVSLIKCKGNVV